MYYEYDEALNKVAGHRTLAINRGENEKILTVKIEAPVEDIIAYLEKKIIVHEGECADAIKEAIVMKADMACMKWELVTN